MPRPDNICRYLLFFFNDTATTEIYTLSLHDALPIFVKSLGPYMLTTKATSINPAPSPRSEEHTSELQSRRDLVCRLLLEKKKSCRARHFFLSWPECEHATSKCRRHPHPGRNVRLRWD